MVPMSMQDNYHNYCTGKIYVYDLTMWLLYDSNKDRKLYIFCFCFRLPTHDSGSSSRKNESVEPAHILSRDFSMTVSSVSISGND